MPDWKQLDWDKKVRERMAPLNLPANSKGEVVAELAAHLAETYDAARTHSLVHDAVAALTLQEVRTWRVLANEISRAKSEENFMTNLPAHSGCLLQPIYWLQCCC